MYIFPLYICSGFRFLKCLSNVRKLGPEKKITFDTLILYNFLISYWNFFLNSHLALLAST